MQETMKFEQTDIPVQSRIPALGVRPPSLALSLTQPWGTGIIYLVKLFETRSWSTAYRGWLFIHAAKGYPGYAKDFAAAEIKAGTITPNIPTGCIIGLANLTAIYSTNNGPFVSKLSEQEKRWGDYSPNRFAWKLDEAIGFAEPIPCKGALGLWPVPSEVIAECKKQMR